MRQLLFYIAFFFSLSIWAQEETMVSGRIMEKGRTESLPFVSVGFKGTKTGTTSDFEGNFRLKTTLPVDTIIISYVGYKTIRKKIVRGQKQHFIIEMQQESRDLKEVIVKPGVNPALRIVKNAQKMRDKNDQSNLSAYDYDSYNKMDVSMTNISEKMKNNLLFRPLKKLFDTTNQFKNDEGKYILPIFISETFSHYYQQVDPSKNKEIVKGNNVSGIGVNQGSYVIDLLGAGMMQFNFNKNWMRIAGKDFISPIASGSLSYYIYTLVDSMEIEGIKCYQIKLNLKREEDLGFLGTMWITDSTFAIKRIDVEMSKSANLNFVDRLKIHQEMKQTSAGPWLAEKTRMIFDISQLTENTSGFVAKMYRKNSNVEVNKLKPAEFYDNIIDRETDYNEKDSSFWNEKRKEPFSKVEIQMTEMIDSIKNLPVMKTYIDVVRLLLDGHYRIGKFDWGPYILMVGFNQVEGMRFRLGFKTNADFSKKIQLKSYVAYGVDDMAFKYGVGVDYFLSTRKFTTIGISVKDDYDILGVSDNSNVYLSTTGSSNIFTAISFAAPHARINRTIDYRINFLTQPKRDWTFHAAVQNTFFQMPNSRTWFGYISNVTPTDTTISHDFAYTAVTLEARYAYKEIMIVRGLDRTRLVRAKAPALTLSYTRGIKGLLGGEFNFDKVQFNISQHLTTGFLGNADYSFTVGQFFGKLPYTILDVPGGNQTFFYSMNNYSLMNLYEFVADRYANISYTQHFEGLFFNRIPLLRNWKLRNFAIVKATYGQISDENKNYIAERSRGGKVFEPVTFYDGVPYMEVGYGIENIFKFLTIGSFHRLTYLNPTPVNQHVRTWGLNVGIRFTF